jgi:hypothetical protein
MRLVVVDLDNTLFRSPRKPEDFKGGWWGKLYSLQPPHVPEDPGLEWWNSALLPMIRQAALDPGTYIVLMTGRLTMFRDRVEALLAQQDLVFDEVLLNNGGQTVDFKIREMTRLISQVRATSVDLYEDRHFEEYGRFLASTGIRHEIHPVVLPPVA